jgi:outer membrane protein OmpA-like peptidoglycan-associated protein
MAAMAAPSAPAVQQPAVPPATPSRGNQQVAVIQFGAGSAGLTSNDLAILQRVAEMQRNNRATVRIVAHAQQDAAGSSADQVARANYEISRQRALAVANQLVRLGVPANRIVAEAASDAEPAFETSSARGIAANRRAEIFVDF